VNVLKGLRFFTMPRALVESGLLKELSPSAVRLYMVLMFLAQKHSAVQLEVPAYEFTDYAGVDWKSVTTAREQLERAGLVICRKGQHGIVAYQLLDPENHLPLPAPDGRRGVRQHRPAPGRSAKIIRKMQREALPQKANGKASSYPPSWDEIACDPEGEPGEHEVAV